MHIRTPLRALALAVSLGTLADGCGFQARVASTNDGTGGSVSDAGGQPIGTGGATASGTGGRSMVLTNLQISPSTGSISVENGGPTVSQQYSVAGTVDGQLEDLTTMVNYAAVPAGIVSVDDNGLATATGRGGGRVTITATAGNQSASATLFVNYSFNGPDPGSAGTGVPADAAALFSRAPADKSRAPRLIYPNDGVLFPPNVTGIEVHFLPGSSANTLFQVTLAGPSSTVSTFIRCAAPAGITGCIYLPDATLWASVAGGNAGKGPVTLTVRGTDDKGTGVGTSDSFTLWFAKDDIQGALYYWTTSGKTAIVRWDFAGATSAPVPYLTPANTDGRTCVGCHALAPNGDKLVASAGGQDDGRLLLWSVAMNKALQPFPLSQKSQFESWNSDGTQFVGVYGDDLPGHKGPSNLMIFDGSTGAVTSVIDLGGLRADHPDWSKSPDGPDTIVFTSADPTAPTTDQKPATGGIDDVRLANGMWGAPQVLVPSQVGKNRYYPAISPDGKLVVYDESTCTRGSPALGQVPDVSCNADTDPTATIFAVPLAGGAAIRLARANSPGVADGSTTALTNSFPKWSPFVQELDEMHNLIWLTFSSTRQYGLRSPPPSTVAAQAKETTTGTLIWMVGISVGGAGTDPSYTAFCLPFQDVTTSNHIAQWAKYFIQGPG